MSLLHTDSCAKLLLSVKAKGCDHWKMCSKNVQNWKNKKFGLGSQQLSWLIPVCLRGFDRNVQQLFPVVSLHQCLQRAVMNKQKQLSISNQHIRVPRWCAFNFAQVPSRSVLILPSNNDAKLTFKKTCLQNIWNFWKNMFDYLDSNPLVSVSYLKKPLHVSKRFLCLTKRSLSGYFKFAITSCMVWYSAFALRWVEGEQLENSIIPIPLKITEK